MKGIKYLIFFLNKDEANAEFMLRYLMIFLEFRVLFIKF